MKKHISTRNINFIIFLVMIVSLLISSIEFKYYPPMVIFILFVFNLPIFFLSIIDKYFDINSKEGNRIQGIMTTISGFTIIAIPYVINFADKQNNKIILFFGAIIPILSVIFFIISNFSKKLTYFKIGMFLIIMFIGSLLTILLSTLIL